MGMGSVHWGFPGDTVVKNPPANAEDAGFIPGSVYQEEGMVNHFGILAWRIPWTDESGGPQSIG